MRRSERVVSSVANSSTTDVAPSASAAMPDGPEPQILTAILRPADVGRSAGLLLSSAAVSGVARAPPSGSAKRPPYGWPAPHGDEDLSHIEQIPRPTPRNQNRPGKGLFSARTRARTTDNRHGQRVSTREDAQHRHHGAYRRRQDDDDRAHPLLHRTHPQDGRGARGRGRDGL